VTLDYNPSRLNVFGEYVTVPTGSYEITSYTSDGPGHSNKWLHCDEQVEGMVIERTMFFSNVVVRNDDEEHVIILVSNEVI
jgi:hypothetical protein